MCMLDATLAKRGAASKQRRQRELQRQVETRANGLAAQVERLLRAYGKQVLRQQERKLRRGQVKLVKSLTRKQLERQLFDVLMRYGLAQVKQAGRTAGHAGFEVTPQLLQQLAQDKQNKVKLLIGETEDKIRRSLKEIQRQALSETPRPSHTEIGRRIARSWFGRTLRENPGRGTRAEERLTADWRRGQTGGPRPGEQEYLFSFDRAATIARTELAQTENLGIVQGIIDAGFARVEWVARPNDGRSGDRRHYMMNNHAPIEVEAIIEDDRENWFTLPSGVRAPYPNWTGLPAGETVNCRCFAQGA